MNKAFIAAGLVSFVTLGIAHAQDNAPDQSTTQNKHASQGHQNQQGTSIEDVLLKKLKKGNDGEIELAKLAQEHSSNQEVKTLAQHLITEHQSMNQKLDKVQQAVMHSHTSANTTNPRSAPARNSAATTERLDTNNGSNATVPQEFCQIGEKACENNLKMTKEMLSMYKGQNFDMAYLGQQCVAHMMTLAELKAIESDGPQELKETATEAAVKVQEHLKMIQELAKKLQDDRKAPNS